MRLLSSDWSEKPSFSWFKATPPQYAILSHTWDDDEVSFQDLMGGLGENKTGYRKVEFCANQAQKDNLQYFWVDTCCIDIWNPREREKAISSMFRWYQNAKTCYVILSDISVPDAADIYRQNSWEPSFKKSKWFTRGWTLQELIAPESVEFFSSEGHFLGSKRSLEHLIREITSLPAKVLQNRSLDEFSVSERMKWATNRTTTEPEDSIYCLLGILNVFVIPSYGEGRDNALNRLQDELDRVDKTPFIVPFSRNNRFIGHETQLAELEAKVFSSEHTTKMAITGPGGIGKSQLVLELAYRTQQRYQNCSVFWISASDMDSFYQSCSYIAQRLDLLGWNDENEDARKLVQSYLSGDSAGQWLLIYDDVDDASLGVSRRSTSQAATLLDFMPQSELGCIIFTTTLSNMAEILPPQNTIELQKMTPGTAQRMLESHLTLSSFTNEQQDIQLLLRELSYLPIAIVQAAAYIEIHKISTKKYLELLNEQKKKTVTPSDTYTREKAQHHSLENPVAKTWLISFDQISYSNTVAADCLFFMSCIDRKDILVDLLPTSSSSETKRTVEILNDYALITKRPASSAVELHRLVHDLMRDYLQDQDLLNQWTQKAITGLAGEFPSPSHENRSRWRRLLPHAKFALAHSLTGQENEYTILAQKCAMVLHEDGRYEEAEKLEVQVIETRKTKLGADHPDTLTSMNNLAFTWMGQGRHDEALLLMKRNFQACQRVLGPQHPHTLSSAATI
ncbi:HET-domain-containing protein, partial [Thozetella sp. PMI_491]